MKEKLGIVLGLMVALALPIASLSATWRGFEGRLPEELGLNLETGVDSTIPIDEEMGYTVWNGFEGTAPEEPELSDDEEMGYTVWSGFEGTAPEEPEFSDDEEMGYTVWSGFEGRTPEEPELAFKAAIDYVISNHDELEGLEVPGSWRRENTTPERLVGATTLMFTGGEWSVTVLFAPLNPSVYDVEIEYSGEDGIPLDGRIIQVGESGFHWEGQVDQDGNVVEIAFSSK